MVKFARHLGKPALFAALIATISLSCTSAAQGKTCTRKDAAAADAMVDHLGNWSAVNRAFMQYRHCDDGEIAEGYSDAIARLLVDHWDTLPRLGTLVGRNPPLESFVLRHVDSTLDTADLDQIKAHATSSCPSGMKRLCKELSKAAFQAEQATQ